MTDNRLESQLRERVKELDCLYSLTKLVEQSENSVDKICKLVQHLFCKFGAAGLAKGHAPQFG